MKRLFLMALLLFSIQMINCRAAPPPKDSVFFYTVFFQKGESSLSYSARKMLMMIPKDKLVDIGGNVSVKGDYFLNLELVFRRIVAIERFLLDRDVHVEEIFFSKYNEDSVNIMPVDTD